MLDFFESKEEDKNVEEEKVEKQEDQAIAEDLSYKEEQKAVPVPEIDEDSVAVESVSVPDDDIVINSLI